MWRSWTKQALEVTKQHLQEAFKGKLKFGDEIRHLEYIKIYDSCPRRKIIRYFLTIFQCLIGNISMSYWLLSNTIGLSLSLSQNLPITNLAITVTCIIEISMQTKVKSLFE